MPISVAPTFNRTKNQQGFSLVEILVAMMLVVTMFTLIPFGEEDPDREKLEETISLMNRTIRFSVNESILRNVLVRIKFDMDTNPIEYSIEYGSGAELVLPETVDLERLSLSERQAREKKLKKFDNQFAPIKEFTDGAQNLPEGVDLYALGTTYNPTLITGGQASIYFYPTGEKDNSLFIFNNEIGMATLNVAPFENKTTHEFLNFNEEEQLRFDETIETKSLDIYSQWLKE